MLKIILLSIFTIMGFSKTHAQESLPDVIVKRLQISDPDISKKQSFYYNRKEEFHQVLVRDLGERTAKKAPASFYVDFLAEKEKVKGNYIVEIRWVNLVFHDMRSRVITKPTGTVRELRTTDGVMRTIESRDEYRYFYPVSGTLEILIYKNENDTLKLKYELSEPLEYDYDVTRVMPSPDKPLIFKELNLTYYNLIRQTILNYFNGKE